MRWILAAIVLTSCASADYYSSKAYRIEQRQKESLKMFETTHRIRKKCAPRRGRPSKAKRKMFYS